jgi:hypothetical protein
MGSSILASLSEAGGNDPFLPVSGPLPPHELVGADRVGTRPTQGHMQVGGPKLDAALTSRGSIFNDLTRALENGAVSSRTDSEPVRDRCPESARADAPSVQIPFTFATSFSNSLFGTHACGIMEVHPELQ